MSLLLTQLLLPLDWYIDTQQPYRPIQKAGYEGLFEPIFIQIPFDWYVGSQQPYRVIQKAGYEALFEPVFIQVTPPPPSGGGFNLNPRIYRMMYYGQWS